MWQIYTLAPQDAAVIARLLDRDRWSRHRKSYDYEETSPGMACALSHFCVRFDRLGRDFGRDLGCDAARSGTGRELGRNEYLAQRPPL